MIATYESTHRLLPGVSTTVRSTVVTTPSGVVVISPIDFTESQLNEIRGRGPVIAIIEPNLHHTAYANSAKASFPKADLWGAEGLPDKMKKPKKAEPVEFSKVLHLDPWPFAPGLQTMFIRGAKKMNESVFFEPESKTLIVTDLVFNETERTGFLTPILFRMIGIYKKFAVANFWISMTDDEKALSQSLKEILALDFDRLIMAHGAIIETGAKSKLEAALREKKLI